MEFSEILQNLRVEKGIKQKDLAKASGLSPQCISALEQGVRSPTGTTLKALAGFFNVSVDYLLGLEDDFGVKSYSPPTVSALTEQEKELLDLFKQLPPERKKMLIYSAQDSLTAWKSKFGKTETKF